MPWKQLWLFLSLVFLLDKVALAEGDSNLLTASSFAEPTVDSATAEPTRQLSTSDSGVIRVHVEKKRRSLSRLLVDVLFGVEDAYPDGYTSFVGG